LSVIFLAIYVVVKALPSLQATPSWIQPIVFIVIGLGGTIMLIAIEEKKFPPSKRFAWVMSGVFMAYLASLLAAYFSISAPPNFLPPVTITPAHGPRFTAHLLNHTDGFWYVIEQTNNKNVNVVVPYQEDPTKANGMKCIIVGVTKDTAPPIPNCY